MIIILLTYIAFTFKILKNYIEKNGEKAFKVIALIQVVNLQIKYGLSWKCTGIKQL